MEIEFTVFAFGWGTALRWHWEEVRINIPLQAVGKFSTEVVGALNGGTVHPQILSTVAHGDATVVELLTHRVTFTLELALRSRRMDHVYKNKSQEIMDD